MNEILPSDNAKALCKNWIREIDSSDFGSHLKQKGNGKMLGLLICTDKTILKAFSGEIYNSPVMNGFVPPCFDYSKVRHLLDDADNELKETEDPLQKRQISRNYWTKIKELYEFTDFTGHKFNLTKLDGHIKSGTGDCCAPRLLSYCYRIGKKPLELAEFFYGDGPYPHLSFQSPCEERCRPVLKQIIGLDILYQDNDIVVVNKPAGILSIEGKGPDKQDCIASRVRNLYNTIKQPCIHRLDQATSGVMVLAKNKFSHDILSKDFENHKIYKQYEALVEGVIKEDGGTISLPIRLDTDNRPHQIVDFEKGKEAITNWEKIKVQQLDGRYVTRLKLVPLTGRTHQLRLHCANGLGHSIVNDPLYVTTDGGRLMLVAKILEFQHPVTKVLMHFEVES